MEQISKFIDCYVETETCNLKCHYCYIAQQGKFNNKLVEFDHSPSEIRKALSVNRLGGVCLLNICAGGETLLAESVLPVVKTLLEEGHFIMIVTNGTVTKRFDEITKWPMQLQERLFIKFSLHYLEMIRLNLLDTFFDNVKRIAESACSYTVEVTANDELIPYIENLKQVCLKRIGALCHVTIARDDKTDGIELLSKYSLEEFYDLWKQFDSKLLDYKYSIFRKERKEFCYAGVWSYYLNLNQGEYRQCYCGKVLGNIYKNTEESLAACPVGTHCELPHCYNGHAFLTLGDIPGLDIVSYADTRNRLQGTKNEWLKPKMKEMMESRLYNANVPYTPLQKTDFELEYYKQRCQETQQKYDELYKCYKELEYWHEALKKDYEGLETGHAELEYWHQQLKAQLERKEF